MNLLLTGATGFVGRRIIESVGVTPDIKITATARRSFETSYARVLVVPELDGSTGWSEVLTDQRVVVHTAARAHIMRDEVADPLAEYRKVNVDGTLNLARQAASAGVKRFIFISSIKVNGEQTQNGQAFKADEKPAPEDAYGISKYEAEQGLQALAEETDMEVVIIRPPLVYGPGVKGNFARMIQLVEKGLPLPLGLVRNKRSLVNIDNLVDLIVTCIDHPAAANQIFLAGDGQDLSTTELLKGVATAAGKPARLLPIPAACLMLPATLLGKKQVAQRLLGSLQVDISKARELLGWEPPVSVSEGLRRCFEPLKDKD